MTIFEMFQSRAQNSAAFLKSFALVSFNFSENVMFTSCVFCTEEAFSFLTNDDTNRESTSMGVGKNDKTITRQAKSKMVLAELVSAIQKDVFACSTDSKRRGINKTIYKYVSPECGVFERLFNSCPVNIFRYLVVARLQLDTVKFEMANGTSLMKKK